MGRLSELFDFINREDVPSEREMNFTYSHISKSPDLMAIRKEYRKRFRNPHNPDLDQGSLFEPNGHKEEP